MQAEPNTVESTARWWLAVDGRPDGPRTTTYITAALQAGQLTSLTPICPEGGCEWRPLATWPAFAATPAPAANLPPSPPLACGGIGANDGSLGIGGFAQLVMNPALPPMGNLITLYAILLVPLYWMLGFVTAFLEDNPFSDDSGYYWAYGLNLFFQELVTLSFTVLLVVAGIRFRDLRSSGARLLRLTFTLWLAWIGLQWVVHLLLFVLAGFAGAYDDSTTDISAWDLIGTFLNTAALAYDVVCLVWLYLKRNQLPLSPN